MDTKALTEDLAKRLERTPEDVAALLDGLSALLKERCGNMENVAIPGFGTFSPVKELERIATDENTGKRMLYPPLIRLYFDPSAILRGKIIGNGGDYEE